MSRRAIAKFLSLDRKAENSGESRKRLKDSRKVFLKFLASHIDQEEDILKKIKKGSIRIDERVSQLLLNCLHLSAESILRCLMNFQWQEHVTERQRQQLEKIEWTAAHILTVAHAFPDKRFPLRTLKQKDRPRGGPFGG